MHIKPLLLTATLVAMAPALAGAKDFSQSLATAPSQVVPAAPGGNRSYLLLINVTPAGGPSAWCSFSLTNKTLPALAPNAPGSFELPAGGQGAGGLYEPSAAALVPDALWCVAASGTVALTALAVQR
ncbi:hypothetical protein [Rhizosaccharibacter radicis]|uniref:Secreted protein n=1 Tax=Rhizosaccharibacter radicis TaxID=2782605 RepID=A0ABT1VVY8_9PROT|nr:hypothetical protein [Acetobacteraceae bacterium KSS12]